MEGEQKRERQDKKQENRKRQRTETKRKDRQERFDYVVERNFQRRLRISQAKSQRQYLFARSVHTRRAKGLVSGEMKMRVAGSFVSRETVQA